MKLFNFVDDAYYINLEHRTDKKEIIETHFRELGILDYVKRKNALSPPDLGYPILENGKYDPFSYGKCCLYSHVEIIKDAKERNLSNVLIFEDDAKFYTDGGYNPLEVIENSLLQLSKIDNWEIFYLGTNPGTSLKEFNLVDENLIKVIEAIGTHAVLISNRIFDKIINEYQNQNVFDIYLTMRYQEKYLAYPMAITQRCGIKNDIGWHNYDGLCEDFWLENYNKKINKLY
jgi:GR25 family glycosyltransferase involved in LPS biosynthesis